MQYVYRFFPADGCHTVGFYDPAGKWCPESDHDTQESAVDRIRFLNGGNPVEEKPSPLIVTIEATYKKCLKSRKFDLIGSADEKHGFTVGFLEGYKYILMIMKKEHDDVMTEFKKATQP